MTSPISVSINAGSVCLPGSSSALDRAPRAMTTSVAVVENLVRSMLADAIALQRAAVRETLTMRRSAEAEAAAVLARARYEAEALRAETDRRRAEAREADADVQRLRQERERMNRTLRPLAALILRSTSSWQQELRGPLPTSPGGAATPAPAPALQPPLAAATGIGSRDKAGVFAALEQLAARGAVQAITRDVDGACRVVGAEQAPPELTMLLDCAPSEGRLEVNSATGCYRVFRAGDILVACVATCAPGAREALDRLIGNYVTGSVAAVA